ncbi:Uncharacterized protein FWK35_00012499, partial [Aphis craccivora]
MCQRILNYVSRTTVPKTSCHPAIGKPASITGRWRRMRRIDYIPIPSHSLYRRHIDKCEMTMTNSERSKECIDFTMMCVLDSERSEECIDFTMMC